MNATSKLTQHLNNNVKVMWKNLLRLDTKKQEKDNASKSKSVDKYMGVFITFFWNAIRV